MFMICSSLLPGHDICSPLPRIAAGALRLAVAIALLLLLLPPLLPAQGDSARSGLTERGSTQRDSTRSDSTHAAHWYDTLTVTQPHYARTTSKERMALSAFTALAIPVAIVVGGISTIPPGVNVLMEDGVARTGVMLSVGLGFGGDTTQIAYFPSFRVQGEYGYYFERSPRSRMAVSVLFDTPITPLPPRKFFWFDLAGGGGFATDLAMYGPFAEGWIGLANPSGIRFVTLFPMHNYGLRARAGYDIENRRPWYELALGGSATF